MHDNRTSEKKERNYWPRFSLRSLFLLVTLIAIGTFVVIRHLRQLIRAVEVIEAIGGSVTCDYEISNRHSVDNPAPPGSTWARWILGHKYFANVIEASLFDAPELRMKPEQFTDTQAAQICELTQVKSLILQNTKLTDDGLKHFRCMTNLRWLDLEGTLVTEAGVEEFHRAMPKVRISYGGNEDAIRE